MGQIALIDMPGLGDTGVGDETRLIEILAQDVDLVLMVRLPRPPRDYWGDVDLQLYDTASKALTALPFKQWSFLILNHTDVNSPIGDNSVYCQDLKSDRENKGLYFADCITANCADPNSVNQKLLDPALNYLVDRLTELDRQYISSGQESLLQLQQDVAAELERSSQALQGLAQNSNYFPKFIELFDELWVELASGLEELLQDLRAERDLENLEFKQQVEAAVAACREDNGIPTEAEIEKMRHSKGGYPNAYYEYLNQVRAHLSQHFLLLDDVLKEAIDRVKTQVAQILIEQGKLGNLTEAREAEFINAIADIIPDNLKRLKLGFQTLAEFELSYRGLIQHRIRQHLDDLTPDETSLQLSPSPSAAEVFEQFESNIGNTNLQLTPDDESAAILQDRLIELKSLVDVFEATGRVGIEGTEAMAGPESLRSFSFGLGRKGEAPSLNLRFYDYPGGYHATQASKEEKEFVKKTLRESTAVLIPIDAPSFIVSGGEYGFEVKGNDLEQLLNSPLLTKNTNYTNSGCKIGSNTTSSRQKLAVELQTHSLPERKGILILITSIKSASALKEIGVWRGLSNRIKDEELEKYSSLETVDRQAQKKTIFLGIAIALILIIAIAILIIWQKPQPKIDLNSPNLKESTLSEEKSGNSSNKGLTSTESPSVCQDRKEIDYFLSPCSSNVKSN